MIYLYIYTNTFVVLFIIYNVSIIYLNKIKHNFLLNFKKFFKL